MLREALRFLAHGLVDVRVAQPEARVQQDLVLRRLRVLIRHDFLTELVEAKVPISLASQMAGHATAAFTLNTYVHHDADAAKGHAYNVLTGT